MSNNFKHDRVHLTILQKIMAPPLSVIKIVKYCGVGGGGARGGGAKILQKIMAPCLFVIKIVKYCGVGGRGGIGCAKILLQRYWRLLPLSSSQFNIEAFGEVGGIGGGTLKSYKDYGAPSLCH